MSSDVLGRWTALTTHHTPHKHVHKALTAAYSQQHTHSSILTAAYSQQHAHGRGGARGRVEARGDGRCRALCGRGGGRASFCSRTQWKFDSVLRVPFPPACWFLLRRVLEPRDNTRRHSGPNPGYLVAKGLGGGVT
eukprot:gene15060-biopygen7901